MSCAPSLLNLPSPAPTDIKTTSFINIHFEICKEINKSNRKRNLKVSAYMCQNLTENEQKASERFMLYIYILFEVVWSVFLRECLMCSRRTDFHLNVILAIHPDLHLYFTNMEKMPIQLYAVSRIRRREKMCFDQRYFAFCLDMDGRYVKEYRTSISERFFLILVWYVANVFELNMPKLVQ